ncbi:hypothetical protein C8R43DRAFT_982126 [Mycena crocata]|nr:hypothetical protein C8R43DRAFT_982126 [Mycena crocata]
MPKKTFDVEVITKAKRISSEHLTGEEPEGMIFSPVWVYRVKWAGYRNSYNTWQHITTLDHCKALIQRFWIHVGNKECSRNEVVNSIVKARPGWIAQEKQRYKSRTITKKNQGEWDFYTPLVTVSTKSTPIVFKIRILCLSVATTPVDAVLSQPDGPSIDPVPDAGSSLLTPPSSPPSHAPKSTLRRSLRMYDANFLTPGSKLATKKRLSKATIAPGVPRASPTPAPSDVPMVTPDDPTFVPDDRSSDEMDDNNPMLTPIFTDVNNVTDIGIYGHNEDPYAGLRNGDAVSSESNPIDSDDRFTFDTNPMDVDEPFEYLTFPLNM